MATYVWAQSKGHFAQNGGHFVGNEGHLRGKITQWVENAMVTV